jgi:hypothetical protein
VWIARYEAMRRRRPVAAPALGIVGRSFILASGATIGWDPVPLPPPPRPRLDRGTDSHPKLDSVAAEVSMYWNDAYARPPPPGIRPPPEVGSSPTGPPQD